MSEKFEMSSHSHESQESFEFDVEAQKVFIEYCGGDIQNISYDEIPEKALERFEEYSHKGLTPDEYTEKNFNPPQKEIH